MFRPNQTQVPVKYIPKAVSVSTDEEMLHISLDNGGTFSIPLARFPRLSKATTQQRQHWRLVGPGIGIHWEEIDEDISVTALLTGTCM
jgi:hypothetical protein